LLKGKTSSLGKKGKINARAGKENRKKDRRTGFGIKTAYSEHPEERGGETNRLRGPRMLQKKKGYFYEGKNACFSHSAREGLLLF